jgi:hypothetical protein
MFQTTPAVRREGFQNRETELDAHKDRFLKHELFSPTLMAAVQRAKVYALNAPEKERRRFQASMRSRLEKPAAIYANQVTEAAHIRNIVKLSAELASAHAKVLNNGQFRIGTAQKSLNLHLKQVWRLGMIPAPPHRPFDFQIIGNLPNYSGPSWTSLNSEEGGRDLIKAAKAEAHDSSLAAWELRTYQTQWRGDRAGPGRRMLCPKVGKMRHSAYHLHGGFALGRLKRKIQRRESHFYWRQIHS